MSSLKDLPNPVRDQIYALAKENNSITESELFLATDILNAAALFEDRENWKTLLLDIPIRQIRGLSRPDFRFTGYLNWGQQALRLHCFGGRDGNYIPWGTEIFDYFDGELSDNPCRIPDSGGKLEIQLYGSMGFCSNGNHRLAAGMVYLASKMGNDPNSSVGVLKKAHTDFYPLSKTKLRRVRELLPNPEDKILSFVGPNLSRPHVFPSDGHIIKVISSGKIHFFYFEDGRDGEITEIVPDIPVKRRLIDSIWRREPAPQTAQEKRSIALGVTDCDVDARNSCGWVPIRREILDWWFENDLGP